MTTANGAIGLVAILLALANLVILSALARRLRKQRETIDRLTDAVLGERQSIAEPGTRQRPSAPSVRGNRLKIVDNQN